MHRKGKIPRAAGWHFWTLRPQLAGSVTLPPLRDCAHFVNLTNGLEALPALQRLGLHPGFVRLQSTLCEQGRFEQVAAELDPSLLLHLAAGRCCLVYDFGSRNKKRGVPRALWMGAEFVRFALTYLWGLERPATAVCRGHNVSADFERSVRAFSPSTKRRLRYYAQYCPPQGLDAVQLYGVCAATERDRDVDFYRAIARSCLQPGAGVSGPSKAVTSPAAQLDDVAMQLGSSMCGADDAVALPSAVLNDVAMQLGSSMRGADDAVALPSAALDDVVMQPGGGVGGAYDARASPAAQLDDVELQLSGSMRGVYDATALPAQSTEVATHLGNGMRGLSDTTPAQLSDVEVQRLLAGDAGVAVRELLGMRLFTGGMSHAEFAEWRARSTLKSSVAPRNL